MSPRRCALLALALALIGAVPAAAAAVPAGPAGLKFYDPPAAKVAGLHGSLIWARPVHGGLIPSVGRTWLVLYRSVSPQGKTVPVSGLVTLPARRAPKGGWPVVSWAHGTTGIADVCAPSRMLGAPTNVYASALKAEMNGWLRRGYAVAQTDYQGLGTPGVHPYLVGVSEGRSVVDIVGAARALNRHVGRRWLASGHSQGGHAALWAAALGPKWAPGLRLMGAVPISPASHLGEQADATRDLDSNPYGGLPALIVAGALTQLAVDPATVLSDQAVALYPQIDRVCLGALGAQDSFGGISIKDLRRPGVDPAPLFAVLSANDPETLTIRVPVLIAQGESDTTAFPMFTSQTVDALRSRGTRVTYKTYPGVNHVQAPSVARADDDAFIHKLLG
jgi:pimeloyl-ACP methyl ester carboxylesterase